MKKALLSLLITFLSTTTIFSQNDLCQNAITLTPSTTCTTNTGTFNGSTISTAAPSCAPNASQDVWYQFVATDPTMRISLAGTSGLDHGFELLQTNCTGSSLVCINANTFNTGETYINNNFIVGQTYLIRVLNVSTTTTALSFNICVINTPAPANDLCNNATIINPSTSCSPITGTFSGSSISTAAPSCAPNATQDVWYQFIATAPTIFIRLNNEFFGGDYGFELFDGSCSGASIACRNQFGAGQEESYLNNNFVVGQTYFIRFFNPTSTLTTASFTFCVASYPTPVNDLCSNATIINPSTNCNTITGTFSGSSISTAAPSCATNATQDVWYQFVATAPTINIRLNNTFFGSDLGFELFDGSCSGASIVCINQGGAGQEESYLNNNFVVGQTYFIRFFIPTAGLTTTSFDFCIQSFPTPANDLCSDATIINPSTSCTTITGTFNGSSSSTAAPTCGPNATQDVWYQFVATVNNLSVSLAAISGLNHGFEVLEGCAGASIACINANGAGLSETTSVTNLIIGNTYFIRVFNASSTISTSSFSLCVFGNVQSTCNPTISIATNRTTICLNNSLTFTSNTTFGGSTPIYQWKVNATNVGTNSPTYTTTNLNNGDVVSCQMTSNAPCASTVNVVSNAITITVNPLPNNAVTQNSTALTAVENNAVYQWFDCNNGNANIIGATSQSFSPTVSGSYGVLVTNSFGCQSQSICYTFDPLSTPSFENKDYRLYPNPVANYFEIQSNVKIDTVIIYNALGQKVSTFLSQTKYNIEDLSSGIYTVEILTENGKSLEKIIKK